MMIRWCFLFLCVDFIFAEKCVDKDPAECAKLTDKQCKFKQDFMTRNCKKTCQMCSSHSPNVDKSSLCLYWKEEGYCKPESTYCRGVLKECLHTCNDDPDIWCNAKTSAKTTAQPLDKCVDEDPAKCAKLTNKQCKFKHDFMTRNCKKTCQMCSSHSTKVDKSSLCVYWKEEGYCKPESTYCRGVLKECPHTCNDDPVVWCKARTAAKTTAQPLDRCVDKNPAECAKLTDKQCKFKHDFMTRNCKKTCQMCSSDSTNVDKSSLCVFWKEEGYCKPESIYCSGVIKECPHTCDHDPVVWCKKA